MDKGTDKSVSRIIMDNEITNFMINTPTQGNGWDCGIFLLMHIYQILKCKGINTLYAQSSCDTFRNYIKYRFSKTDYEEKSYQEIKKPNQNILSNPDMISSISNDIKKQSIKNNCR